ncbi:hypothetical protein [Clavibacter sp. VKM Ac-2542]|uniref:DUF6414 family protein n=1 Tax=Clavibacter sp. VKM Ac-2542 TaxID=2783811 RepID=UPI00188C786A|nr:hypothetical protein [Clavibacter sp. VKM Ac-2542]MBF4621514.1 hypothetical protein [Clavibacter sp. VKM Ac-2542]
MLRNFYYLDENTLNRYISAIEGGLVSEETRRELNGGELGGGVDFKVAAANAGKTHENERSQTLGDNADARFSRLLKAAELQPEALSWIEVMQPDIDFKDITLGMIIDWECELRTPDYVNYVAKAGEASQAIRMAQDFASTAKALGLDTTGMPAQEQLDAMSGAINSLNLPRVIIGQAEGSPWQFFSQIRDEFAQGELDGYKRVVGKVTRVVPAGTPHELVKLPGARFANRQARRSQGRPQAATPDQGQTLTGPAVELDLLAVYL